MGQVQSLEGWCGTGNETNSLTEILKAFSEPISRVIADQSKPQAETPAPATAKQIEQPTAERLRILAMEKLKANVVKVVQMATLDIEPDTAFDLIIANTPESEVEKIIGFIMSENWFEIVCKMDAQAIHYAEWFDALEQHFMQFVEVDKSDTILTDDTEPAITAEPVENLEPNNNENDGQQSKTDTHS